MMYWAFCWARSVVSGRSTEGAMNTTSTANSPIAKTHLWREPNMEKSNIRREHPANFQRAGPRDRYYIVKRYLTKQKILGLEILAQDMCLEILTLWIPLPA